jgi:hypothetical protein
MAFISARKFKNAHMLLLSSDQTLCCKTGFVAKKGFQTFLSDMPGLRVIINLILSTKPNIIFKKFLGILPCIHDPLVLMRMLYCLYIYKAVVQYHSAIIVLFLGPLFCPWWGLCLWLGPSPLKVCPLTLRWLLFEIFPSADNQYWIQP